MVLAGLPTTCLRSPVPFLYYLLGLKHHLLTTSFLRVLGHSVQCATVLEPFDLSLVECLVKLNLERLAVLGVYDHGQGLANG